MISTIKAVPVNSIFLGNGSDEAIDLLIRAFCIPSYHNVVIPSPTYGMYAVSAAINEVHVKSVPLTPAFALDVDAILKATDDRTRIVFLCSPNNPTGNLLSFEAIEGIINRFEGLVVVDEAYIDFTERPSLVRNLSSSMNLIVLQTLSKAWGLAGLRLGMAFAHPEIISLLDKIKPPYNISSIAQEIAKQALTDADVKQRRVKELLKERERMSRQLGGLKSVYHVFPSDANFVLVKIKEASRAYQFLVKARIVVRDRSKVALCEDCLRITIGTPEENSRLLTTLASYE
jgi:histidinol-phosphate aminotransferase